MKWYNSPECNGIILSTRVRLARNIKGYPFASKITSEQKAAMIKDVRNTFDKFGTDRYNFIDMSTKSLQEKNLLVEEHIISTEFASIPSSEKSMLVFDENSSTSVMVGEEDHIRIQAIKPGFSVKEAFEAATSLDEMLSKGLDFAFDNNLGYLTCCPSNTGTGMRISCMVHLPMLARNDNMKSVFEYCSRLGLTVRGFFGEGSKADGEIYQISNQITLGISEEETIKRIEEAVTVIANKEKSLRNQLRESSEAIQDKLWRSYGILTNVRCISSKEFLSLWSDCMLAKDCGIIEALGEKNMIRLLINCMPAHIAGNNNENVDDASKRDVIRAARIRNEFSV